MKSLRAVGVLAATIGGLAYVAPRIESWATFSSGVGPMLLASLGLFLAFALGALSVGAFAVRRCYPTVRPDGFWALSFASGVGIAALSCGFCAWFQLVGPRFFVLLPMVLFSVGAPTLLAELRSRPWPRPQLSPLEVVALGFGAVCLATIALQTIAPDNINFDSAWYHLRAAERYALNGGMVRVNEGDLLLTLPQTSSWLYTWAFCWPGVLVEDRVRLALMLEYGTVLGTLAVIPALTRALAPQLDPRSTRLAWVAWFFFPSIFIYDTGVMGGSDHIVTLWSVSTLLAWFHARRTTERGPWVLFGLNMACLLAKYSSLYVIIPLVLIVGIDWLIRLQRVRFAGPLIAAAVALLLTSPYWLRNAIWYHNPVYPAAAAIFPNTPWSQDSAAWLLYTKESTEWTSNGVPSHNLKVSLQAMLNYDIDLNTWGDMTGGQPIVGAMYFLSLLALPFITGRRRLLLLAFIVNLGIGVWFNTHQHQMRYLTVLMAPMAAGVAAVGLIVWRDFVLLGRIAVLGAIGFHVVAFADTPFRRTHRLAGSLSTIGVAEDYLARRGGRTGKLSQWETIGNLLPPNAKPLVHGSTVHLGLGRQSLTDVTGLQFGIDYARWGSVPATLEKLKQMGATHLIWLPHSDRLDSVAGEAIFSALTLQTRERKQHGAFAIGELPDTATDPGRNLLYVGCGHLFRPGLYTLEQLAVPQVPWYHPWPQPGPIATAPDWRSLLPRAAYVAIEADCNPGEPSAEFARVIEQTSYPRKLRYYVRTSGQPIP